MVPKVMDRYGAGEHREEKRKTGGVDNNVRPRFKTQPRRLEMKMMLMITP